MRKTIVGLCLLLFSLHASAANKTWPETKVGALAKGWAAAFSRGEPAMRTYLAENMAPEKLAERSVDQRLETYRKLRERFGTLKLLAVGENNDATLHATLETSDGTAIEFTFDAQTAAPHKLLGVRFMDQRMEHGQGHGH